MKNIILSFILVFFLQNAFSQDTTKKYKSVQKTTEMVSFYENGQVKEHGYFNQANQLDGNWMLYSETGDVLVQGQFEAGKKVGKWLFWDKDNLKEVDFEANKLVKYNKWTKAEYLAQK